MTDHAANAVIEVATKFVQTLTEEEWYDLFAIGRQSGVIAVNQEGELQALLLNLSLDVSTYEAFKE